jgi:hypothetical protein
MADLARAVYLVHRAQCGLIHAATPLPQVIVAIPLDHTARVRAEVTADLRTAARHMLVRRMADRPAAVIRRVAQATAHRVEVRLMVVDTPAIAHRLHPTPPRRVVAVMEAEEVVVTTVVAVGAAPTVAEAEAGATADIIGNPLPGTRILTPPSLKACFIVVLGIAAQILHVRAISTCLTFVSLHRAPGSIRRKLSQHKVVEPRKVTVNQRVFNGTPDPEPLRHSSSAIA